jgi:ABC-type transporter MlaC component
MVFSTLVSALFFFSLNTQGLGSSGEDKSKPIEGSQMLWTSIEILPNSGVDFVVRSIKDLEKVVEVINSAKGAESKAAENKLRQMVSGILDLDHLGQRAMITHWQALEKTASGRKQREEYMKLFKSLIEENYMEQARKYIGSNYKLTLTGNDPAPKSGITLVTGRIKKTDVDVIVEFDVKKVGEVLKIADLRLDATSLESTYRSSFNRIIRRNGGLEKGFPELLTSMRKRLTDLQKGSATRL